MQPRHSFPLFVAAAAVALFPCVPTSSWTLTDGQRILPKTSNRRPVPVPPPQQPPQPYQGLSLFDLPALESWCTERKLKPLHLKKIYNVLLRGGLGREPLERLQRGIGAHRAEHRG